MILNIPDIVYEVAAFVREKRDLRELSLLNSTWLNACKPLLWRSIQLTNEGAKQCLIQGIKKHGHFIRDLELVTNLPKTSDDDMDVIDTNSPTIVYTNWKLVEEYCSKLQSLAAPFSTSKHWNKVVTGILKLNPGIRTVTIYERLPISEPSAAPWFVCESSSRKQVLMALVKISSPQTQFVLKLSSTYSFELRPEFYGINDFEINLRIYTSHFNPVLLENEGMGDNMRSEYIDFRSNTKTFRQQIGKSIELFIECENSSDCACQKARLPPMNGVPIADAPDADVDNVPAPLIDEEDLAFITPLILPIPVIPPPTPIPVLPPPTHPLAPPPPPIMPDVEPMLPMLPWPAMPFLLPPPPPPTEVEFDTEDDALGPVVNGEAADSNGSRKLDHGMVLDHPDPQ